MAGRVGGCRRCTWWRRLRSCRATCARRQSHRTDAVPTQTIPTPTQLREVSRGPCRRSQGRAPRNHRRSETRGAGLDDARRGRSRLASGAQNGPLGRMRRRRFRRSDRLRVVSPTRVAGIEDSKLRGGAGGQRTQPCERRECRSDVFAPARSIRRLEMLRRSRSGVRADRRRPQRGPTTSRPESVGGERTETSAVPGQRCRLPRCTRSCASNSRRWRRGSTGWSTAGARARRPVAPAVCGITSARRSGSAHLAVDTGRTSTAVARIMICASCQGRGAATRGRACRLCARLDTKPQTWRSACTLELDRASSPRIHARPSAFLPVPAVSKWPTHKPLARVTSVLARGYTYGPRLAVFALSWHSRLRETDRAVTTGRR